MVFFGYILNSCLFHKLALQLFSEIEQLKNNIANAIKWKVSVNFIIRKDFSILCAMLKKNGYKSIQRVMLIEKGNFR